MDIPVGMTELFLVDREPLVPISALPKSAFLQQPQPPLPQSV